MTRDDYVNLLTRLLFGTPKEVREANLELYSRLIEDSHSIDFNPDIALAEATMSHVKTK